MANPRRGAPQAQPDANQAMAARLADYDLQRLRREFVGQGAFLSAAISCAGRHGATGRGGRCGQGSR